MKFLKATRGKKDRKGDDAPWTASPHVPVLDDDHLFPLADCWKIKASASGGELVRGTFQLRVIEESHSAY